MADLTKHLKKKFGEEAVQSLDEESVVSRVDHVYKTGSLALDRALGIGGIPGGRIVELYGTEGSGKTTLALSIVARAQASGATVLYLDTENALDPTYAEAIGVDTKTLILSQCDSIESVFRLLKETAEFVMGETKGKDRPNVLVIWDSVAATPTETELSDDKLDSKEMAQVARAISTNCRKVFGRVAEAKITFICINQEKEKLGVMFGSPSTTPGGKALKFASTIRIKLRQGTKLQEGGEHIGQLMGFRIEKNKVAPPFKTGEIPLIFGKGFDYPRELLEEGVTKGLISHSGAWYTIEGVGEKFQRKDWDEVLKSYEDLETLILNG